LIHFYFIFRSTVLRISKNNEKLSQSKPKIDYNEKEEEEEESKESKKRKLEEVEGEDEFSKLKRNLLIKKRQRRNNYQNLDDQVFLFIFLSS